MMGTHESPLPPGGEFGALSMEETGWNGPAAARQASNKSNAISRKRKCIIFIKILPLDLIHLGRVEWSWSHAMSGFLGEAVAADGAEKLSGGVVRGSRHWWISPWPSANAKLAARWWYIPG